MKLDHIVIGTRDLEEGTRYLESCLRCTLAPGGQHIGFGTHNRLLNLGDGAYLELIALDPAQRNNPAMPIHFKAPFGLGTEAIQLKIAQSPQLIAWVVNTSPIAQQQELFEHVGNPTTMRRGDLSWSIAQRADGQPVPSGLPTLIEWGATPHPSGRLPQSTTQLKFLKVFMEPMFLSTFGELASTDARVQIHDAQQPDLSRLVSETKLNLNKRLLAHIQIGEGEYFEL